MQNAPTRKYGFERFSHFALTLANDQQRGAATQIDKGCDYCYDTDAMIDEPLGPKFKYVRYICTLFYVC